jgi:hypothetical protein
MDSRHYDFCKSIENHPKPEPIAIQESTFSRGCRNLESVYPSPIHRYHIVP